MRHDLLPPALQWRRKPPELPVDSRFLPVAQAAVHVQAAAAARCGSGYAAVPWALPALHVRTCHQGCVCVWPFTGGEKHGGWVRCFGGMGGLQAPCHPCARLCCAQAVLRTVVCGVRALRSVGLGVPSHRGRCPCLFVSSRPATLFQPAASAAVWLHLPCKTRCTLAWLKSLGWGARATGGRRVRDP